VVDEFLSEKREGIDFRLYIKGNILNTNTISFLLDGNSLSNGKLYDFASASEIKDTKEELELLFKLIDDDNTLRH
jgi:hypothetical protein